MDACTKKINNLAEGVKGFVAKGISQIVPDVFHRVEFRTVRQERNKDHVFGDS